ncbi:MAG: T9SS type A sorting domain-containing protein [Candidatus Kapabacteria bacterium]|nr:T9SS type A sorting domain-containing protein [Candidatus Kapabacteria bacterium]
MKRISLYIGLILPILQLQLHSKDYWEQVPGNLGYSISCFAFTDKTNIIVGCYDGIFHFNSNMSHWERVSPRMTGVGYNAIEVINNKLFTATATTGVIRAENNNYDWIAANTGLCRNIESIVFDKDASLYAANDDLLYRSTNSGDTWKLIYKATAGFRGSSLALDSNGNIFLGDKSGIIKSTDKGESWITIKSEIISDEIKKIAINADGTLFAASDIHLYKSDDAAASWSAIDVDFNNNHIQAIGININNLLFVGTENNGVFASTDEGDTWEILRSGLDGSTISSFGFDKIGYIYIGTQNGNVFRSSIAAPYVQEIETIAENNQQLIDEFLVYPNPFSTRTTIKFVLPQQAAVSLTIVGETGKLIAEIITLKQMESGEYQFFFDADMLPSGAYFCTLTVNNHSQSIKLMLLK